MIRNNYDNFPFRLEQLKELCNYYGREIIIGAGEFASLHEGESFLDLTIRFVIDNKQFGYAQIYDIFFIDDCMYYITDDDKYKDFNNPDIRNLAADLFGGDWLREERYVFRVIFAGVQTPYKDNLGDWIYTGDLVKVMDDIISGVCAFPPYNDDEPSSPALYGVMLDNCMIPLHECKFIERLGTIFFKIEKGETEIDIESEIGGRAQHGGFDEDELLCANYTPSFDQEQWKYSALEIIGVEYNWRK